MALAASLRPQRPSHRNLFRGSCICWGKPRFNSQSWCGHCTLIDQLQNHWIEDFQIQVLSDPIGRTSETTLFRGRPRPRSSWAAVTSERLQNVLLRWHIYFWYHCSYTCEDENVGGWNSILFLRRFWSVLVKCSVSCRRCVLLYFRECNLVNYCSTACCNTTFTFSFMAQSLILCYRHYPVVWLYASVSTWVSLPSTMLKYSFSRIDQEYRLVCLQNQAMRVSQNVWLDLPIRMVSAEVLVPFLPFFPASPLASEHVYLHDWSYFGRMQALGGGFCIGHDSHCKL